VKSRQQVLGQNFLKHTPTIEKIITSVRHRLEQDRKRGIAPKAILEVGPGALALTKTLAKIAADEKLDFVIVERDRFLEEGIRTGLPQAEVHFFDAATEKLAELFDQLRSRGSTPILFVSNLPYSAASQILAAVCKRIELLSSAVVMVQKEMAQRIIAPEKSEHRGSFSLFMQSYFAPKILFDVPPGAFSPPPKVMSTVLDLVPLEKTVLDRIEQPLEFEKFCKKLFSQRRKMIRNSLNLPKTGPLPDAFAKLGINGTERAEVLDFETVLQLYLASGGK